ncbi:Inositol polyphosphate 5-phosphatase [Globisporangium polare]
MPRASNRVGVEVDAAPSAQTPPADLLKAKKAERRARARQRAEEKRLKEEEAAAAVTASIDSSEPAAASPQASDHDQRSALADLPASQQSVTDGEDALAVRRPTTRGKRKKLQTPEADEEPAVVVKQAVGTAARDDLSDTQEVSVAETVSVSHSSLEEARAEFATEEVINVDAYVSKLSSDLHQQPVAALSPAQDPNETAPRQPLHRKSKARHAQKPTSPDAAASRIQKALKRKFLKKTLKKCASFLRHSSKVFAEVDFAPSSSPSSRPPGSASRSPSPAPAATDTADGGSSSSLSASLRLALSSEVQGDASPGQHQYDDNTSVSDTKRDEQGKPKARATSASDPISEDDEKRRKEQATENKVEKRNARDKSKHGKRNRHRESSEDSSKSSDSSSDQGEESSPRTSSSSRSSRSESSSSSSSSGAASSSSSSSSSSGPTLGLLHAAVATDPAGKEEEEPALSAEFQQQQYNPEAYSYSAVKIQAWLRGVEGRRQALLRRVELEREIESEALFEVHEEASVRIQAIIRGFLVRRQLGVMNQSPASLRKNGNKASKKKNRHASITAFFKGDDTQETSQRHQHQRSITESVEKRAAIIEEEVIEEQTSGNASPTRKDSEADVAEWPAEFNLEQGLDEWEELNSAANLQGDLVTSAHFLAKGKLRVFCGTWNMHAKRPVDDLRLWIPLNKYHVVAVGSEECVNSIAKSVVFTSKRQWEALLKDTLGAEYVLVCSHSLTAIHNVVFVHESVLPLLSSIQSDAVATGLGNQLGNKGGVGIAFVIGRTSFAFVNCHFDAHQHNTEKRNGNFHRINQELRLFPGKQGVPSATASSISAHPTSSAVTGQASLDGLGRTTTSRFSMTSSSGNNAATAVQVGKKRAVSECFDRVFWFGDLNYRVNGTRRMVDLLLLHNKHDVLRFNDQLQIEMAKGHVFNHFKEGPLHFRPTYKFDKHSNVYDSSSKQRIPSWTDRILYLSNDKAADIEILSYRAQMTFQTSDHRPVGAAFQVSFKGNAEQQMLTGESSSEFSRVLARGYRPTTAKSEVCVVQ